MGTLTFFKIKPEFTKPDDIIKNRSALRVEPVKVGKELVGQLHLKRIERPEPEWFSYFAEAGLHFGKAELKTASLAAVLLVCHEHAWYAIVFGYGASLLVPGVVDERFGLRATLSGVEESQLRSLDHKRLEAISRLTRENLSKAGALGQFGLDINRDLLRAVTGRPRDSAHGSRLSGADQLTVTADIPLHRLKTELSRYNALAESGEYKKNFPWVDNIQSIRDKVLVRELDEALAKALTAGSEGFWLAPPDLIDWGTTAGFRYRSSKGANQFDDLSLEDYAAESGSLKDLDAARLRNDKVIHIRSDTDNTNHSWSLMRCIVGELEYKKERYVVSEGAWYRVNDDFLGKLNDFVAGIPTAAITLPAYSGGGEGAYNKKAWKANKSELVLLDQNFIHYKPRGRVEVCDLYSKSKQFIHVKRLNGSSTLSHLFNQGTVSAELMAADAEFRKAFIGKLPAFAWGKAADPIVPRDFEVCYAIICRPNQHLELPFFSKLTLRTAAQQLDRLGFRVSLRAIPSS